jgi:hypothetical protein
MAIGYESTIRGGAGVSDAIPEKLGKYDVVRPIGRGSMGIDY